MQASQISKIIVWITVAWVILASQHRITNAGPLTFASCVTQAAGPICASAAATGKYAQPFLERSFTNYFLVCFIFKLRQPVPPPHGFLLYGALA
jgi:hypothetical protein